MSTGSVVVDAVAVAIGQSFCGGIGVAAGFGEVDASAIDAVEPVVVVDTICPLDTASIANTGDGSGLLTKALLCGIVGVFGDPATSDFMIIGGF